MSDRPIMLGPDQRVEVPAFSSAPPGRGSPEGAALVGAAPAETPSGPHWADSLETSAGERSIPSDTFLVRTEPRYPAFPYTGTDSELSRALRALWLAWGRDPDNPFRGWVAPGGRVVIKPNWVRDFNPDGHDLDSLITHSALIHHVIEWSAAAMEGHGSVVIGDAPIQSCDFARLTERSRIGAVLDLARRRYPELEVIAEDWRLTLFGGSAATGAGKGRSPQRLRADLENLLRTQYRIVDLGQQSFLEEIADYADRFRVTCYQPSLMRAHHAPGKHEYLVTMQVFDADLLVNLPKVKTHNKGGLTGALKNLVGINGHKEYLPHHILGPYTHGGDCYMTANRFCRWYDGVYDRFWEQQMQLSSGRRFLYSALLDFLWAAARSMGGDSISAGGWSGNETIWRTTLDLNHILHFSADSAKHIITIADGVVAGEGEGPLRPTPKPAGILVAGQNPAYVDATLATVMGYNIARLPTVYHALYHRKSRLAGPALEAFNVTTVSAGGEPEILPIQCLPSQRFVKPKHWQRAEARPWS